jgi:hypothetical protein
MALALAALPSLALESTDPLALREVRYEWDASIDYEAETLAAEVALTVENHGTEPAGELHLLLYRLLTVDEVKDSRGAPLEFVQDIVSMEDDPVTQVNYIRVELPTSIAPSARTTVRILYSGHLLGYAETGSLYIQDRIDEAFTILRKDALAYPEVGVPSYATNRAAGLPEFDYLARITVPKGRLVANGGELVDRTESDGTETAVYRNTAPAWRMDFAIADYRVLESGSLRVYHFPEDAAGAAGVMAALESTLSLYKDWFGPLEGPAAFAVIEIPDGWGSQADVTSIIQTAAAFKDDARHFEVYHEISHLWNVGPLDISPRWNEGLATFLMYLTADHLESKSRLRVELDRILDRIRRRAAENRHYSETPMIDYGRRRVTDLSYSVGALMFALLHEIVGPAEFNEIVGGFYRRYRLSGATTEDFVKHASDVASPDLGKLFADWLYTTAWLDPVSRGASFADLIERYRRPPATTSASGIGVAEPGITRARRTASFRPEPRYTSTR